MNNPEFPVYLKINNWLVPCQPRQEEGTNKYEVNFLEPGPGVWSSYRKGSRWLQWGSVWLSSRGIHLPRVAGPQFPREPDWNISLWQTGAELWASQPAAEVQILHCGGEWLWNVQHPQWAKWKRKNCPCEWYQWGGLGSGNKIHQSQKYQETRLSAPQGRRRPLRHNRCYLCSHLGGGWSWYLLQKEKNIFKQWRFWTCRQHTIIRGTE